MLKPPERVYLAAFLMDFVVISFITVLPFFIFNQLHAGAALSGLIGGTQSAFYAVVCLASANFVARARNGMVWAYTGIVGFTLFACLVPFFRNPWICGAAVTISFGLLSLFWPAMYSWIGGEPELTQRARKMARFNIAWSFGFATGPLVAGPLYDIDYRLPFVVMFVVELGVLFLVLSVPHEGAHYEKPTEEMLDARALHDRASERFLYLGWSANLVSNFISGVTRTVFPKRIEDLVNAKELRLLWEDHPLDLLTAGAATKYSWLAFALSLMIAIMFIWMGRDRRWEHKVWPLLWLQAAAGCAFWMLGRTESLVVMVLCFMVVGANSGIAFFAAVYYSVANPLHKHRRASINEGVVGIGGFTGSILFGFLAHRYGVSMPFTWTPVFIAIALALQIPLIPRRDH